MSGPGLSKTVDEGVGIGVTAPLPVPLTLPYADDVELGEGAPRVPPQSLQPLQGQLRPLSRALVFIAFFRVACVALVIPTLKIEQTELSLFKA